MTEIGFYHLTRSLPEQALPRLLARSLKAGARCLVLLEAAAIPALDDLLWNAPDAPWLPHGVAGGAMAEHQPILLAPWEDAAEAADGAGFLFTLRRTGPLPPLGGRTRVFDLFEAADVAQLEAARGRWREARDGGLDPTYWRQTEKGWEKGG